MQNSSIWFFIQKHLEPISLSQLKLDNCLPQIISLDSLTKISFLFAHPQVIYNNYSKFHKYWLFC